MTAPFELVDVRLDHPRGGAPLVTGANLRVAAGEVVLIVGAAGVGTSRLVAAALGEIPLAAGELRVLGRDVRKLRSSSLRLLRRRIGIVPQNLCLLEDRSAQLNVVLPLEIDGIPRSISIARAAEGLAAMGLEDVAGIQVDALPASVRQRVAVARALVRDPDLVLADHPTSAQDPDGCARVAAALEATARDRGKAVLVFARDPVLRAYAEAHAWRQLALVDGELRPLGEIVLDSGAIDSSLVDSESLPNLVQFPRPDSGGGRPTTDPGDPPGVTSINAGHR